MDHAVDGLPVPFRPLGATLLPAANVKVDVPVAEVAEAGSMDAGKGGFDAGRGVEHERRHVVVR